MFVVETEFLFGLVPRDLKNATVEKALDLIKERGIDVRCLASGILEVVFVAKSFGKEEGEIRGAVSAMLSKMREHGIGSVESIGVNDILGCLSLRELYATTFYDSLHASSALNRSATLISNDKTYDKIDGLERISFQLFVRSAKPWRKSAGKTEC